MSTIPFKQVDVFTRAPFKGNPVAVVLKADHLSSAQMQAIANWTNLSETTFVLSPSSTEADYRLRIFTPHSELPFAGHPTIGTAHAVLEAGLASPRQGALIQECGVGLVRLEITSFQEERRIGFTLPPSNATELTDAQIDELEAVLGAAVLRHPRPRLIDVGARWIVAQMEDAKSVLAVCPDYARMHRQDTLARATGVVIFGPHDASESAQFEVRAFAPSCGVNEDPVCGSGNGCVAVFLRDSGQLDKMGGQYLASQGQVLGRSGEIYLSVSEHGIQVSGNAVTCIEGYLTNPRLTSHS